MSGKIETFDEGRIETRSGHEFENRRFLSMVHEREQLDIVGRLACSLVEKWGLVAAMPAGEDSAGRQASALPKPDEIADRAVAIAESLVHRLRDSGHTFLVPSMAEFYALDDDKKS